jgi:DNA-binding NarL/FixJ family response regulator
VAVPIRVVLADDAFLIREGLRQLLELRDGIEVAAVAEDLDGTRAAIHGAQPDVVITDLRMPPTRTDEGIRIADELRRERPGIGVVLLSQFCEPTSALALLRHGAAGRAYMLKERVHNVDELMVAVRSVVADGSFIDPAVIDAMVAGRISEDSSPLRRLTPRELGVLESMARGMNNAAISARLQLALSSVEKHVSSVFAKLDLDAESGVDRRVMSVLTYLNTAVR